MLQNNKKKKIILSGYYGFGNAGDEAVLAALCQILRERFGDLGKIELVALSARPEQTAAAYGPYGLRAIDRWDKGALRRELAEASLFCSGGGSLLQDVTSVRSVWYYTSLLGLAQKMGVPTMVLAQGLGPLNTWAGRWLTKRTLKHCRLLSWRDEDSLALAAKLGLGKLPNYLVCDPVLRWQPDVEKEAERTHYNGSKRVGLALRPWPLLRLDAVAKLAVLLRERGLTPVLLPFYQGEAGDGEDAKLAAEINKELANSQNEPLPVLDCHNPWEAQAAIGQVDLLLGMRLHSLIMAARQGVAAYAVNYDPKVRAFAAAVGIEQAAGGVSFDPEAVAEQLVALAEQRPEYDIEKLTGRWEALLAEMEKLLSLQ